MTQFRSKVDLWLWPLLGLPLLAGIGVAGASQRAGAEPAELWIGLGVLGFVVLLYGGLIFPMRYELCDDHLLVAHGLMRQRFPYADIRQVEPTRNALSAPALSLDRLAVRSEGRAELRISPADQQAFVDALAARCPHLTADGLTLGPA